MLAQVWQLCSESTKARQQRFLQPFLPKATRSSAKMKIFLQIAFLLAVINSVYCAKGYAWCQFQGTSNNPNLTGYAYFIPGPPPSFKIEMHVSVSGIYQNVGVYHGIHIHEFGDISDKNAAASVGSHYNPTNASHGCEDESSPQWHVGDTGNWYVDSTGAITGSKTLSSVLLTGPNSIIGRAVVIHNRTDDCNVTSSSQSRLGFCVIGIGNPALSGTDLTVNDAVSEATYVPIGVCDLQQIGTSGVSGRVWLTPSTEGLKVDAIVYNLTGTHGFHIHQYGDLSQTQNGNSTGGHYNPYNVSHGIPPYKERHLGDLGNIYHELNSTAMAYSYTITEEPYVNLTGLYNVIGRAMIIHSAPDNCSQPTGGAGSRLAYCVIGIGNVTTTSPLAAYTSVPTTQDDNLCKDDSGAVELLVSASLVFWAFMAVLF